MFFKSQITARFLALLPGSQFAKGFGHRKKWASRSFAQILVLLTLSGVFLSEAHAQSFAEQMSAKCPTLTARGTRMNQMCNAISGIEEAEPGSAYKWAFEEIICENAGVDSTDTKEQIGRKVQTLWYINQDDELCCTSNHFGVERGNIIKFAAKKGFLEFFYACWDWGLELNRIDKADGMTIADWIKKQNKAHPTSVNAPFLEQYLQILQKAGAKYRSEIEAALKASSQAYGQENVGSYGHGLVPVKKDQKWGLADEAGKLIVPCEYSEVLIIGKDYFAVRKANPTFFFINRENKKMPGPWDADPAPAGKKE